MKAEQELADTDRRLSASEEKSCELEGEVSRLSAGLRQAADDLHTKRLENGILQQRLFSARFPVKSSAVSEKRLVLES